MRFLITTLILLITNFSSAQKMFSGQVVDAKTGQELAYVNIGVLGGNIGTVSNSEGKFSLPLPALIDKEKIKISMVGYEAFSLPVSEFKKQLQRNPTIKLQAAIVELTEVVVVPKFNKTKTLGNKIATTRLRDGFDEDVLGREGGIVVKLKRKYQPAHVLKFRMYIAHSTYDTIKFRLNFYSLKDKLPGAKIVQKNIIVTSSIKEGAVEVNLEDYQIVVEDDFCVTIEWIEDFGRGNLLFPFRRLGARCVYRNTSQADWVRFPFMSPAMNVTIGY